MAENNDRNNDAAALRRAEGRRRYELIRQLVQDHGRTIPAARMQEVGRALGVSPTTVYRLVRLFRKHGTVDALQPRPRGRPEGSRLLSDHLEAIISDVIEEVRLDRTRPTLTHLVERVHARCATEGLPRPHRRTIRARFLAASPDRKRSMD